MNGVSFPRLLKLSILQTSQWPHLWFWGFISALGSTSILNFNPNVLHIVTGNRARIGPFSLFSSPSVLEPAVIAVMAGAILAVVALIGRGQLIQQVAPKPADQPIRPARFWARLWRFNLILSVPFVVFIIASVLSVSPILIFGGTPDLTFLGVNSFALFETPLWIIGLCVYTVLSMGIQAWGERMLVLEGLEPWRAMRAASRFLFRHWRSAITLSLCCFGIGVVWNILIGLICGAFFQPLMMQVPDEAYPAVGYINSLVQRTGAFLITLFAASLLSAPFTTLVSAVWTNAYCRLKQDGIQSAP